MCISSFKSVLAASCKVVMENEAAGSVMQSNRCSAVRFFVSLFLLKMGGRNYVAKATSGHTMYLLM